MVEAPLIAALNHLLVQEPWARERLVPFAGKEVELRAPPFPPLRLAIRESGLAMKGGAAAVADAVVTLRPGAVEITGDNELADALRFLQRNLRWDFEESLSKVVGDIAARRMVQAGNDLAAWQRDAAGRLTDALGAYIVDEKRLVVRRDELERYARDIAALREGIERLERRLGPLA